jgi:hypothetical protein
MVACLGIIIPIIGGLCRLALTLTGLLLLLIVQVLGLHPKFPICVKGIKRRCVQWIVGR